jgi:hypothetical protein
MISQLVLCTGRQIVFTFQQRPQGDQRQSDQETISGLSNLQREAILELGSRGSGGEFDPVVMSQLLTLGVVEIHSKDRRLVLTELGRRAFDDLSRC